LVDMVRRGLRGKAFVPAGERFQIVASKSHGNSVAVLRASAGATWPACSARGPVARPTWSWP